MKLQLAVRWITFLGALSVLSLHARERTDEEIETADYKALLTEITPLAGTTPAQWRVTWTGDTATTATISWSTALAGEKHILHFGTNPGGSDSSKYKHHLSEIQSGAYSMTEKEAADTETAYYHHRELRNLKPATNYYFLLESDGELSRPLYFRTSAKSGDFKLLVGGDSRSGLVERCRMNLKMAQLLQQNPAIVALNHGGDFVAAGERWRQWRLWLSHHELTTTSDGRVLPIIPTRGNHDGGPLIFEVFNLKKPADKLHLWYSTQLPEEVNLLVLDTNFSAKGAQEQWLDEQLATLRPKSTWLLTAYHRPLHPAVKPPAGQAAIFVPLFEKYNVDLACEADGHCIKRTVPIRNGEQDSTGVTYIGEGGLGVGQYQPKIDRWYLQGGYVSRGHHVMLLSFSRQALQVTTILLNGQVADDAELLARPQQAR
jgi:hypothetical protein